MGRMQDLGGMHKRSKKYCPLLLTFSSIDTVHFQRFIIQEGLFGVPLTNFYQKKYPFAKQNNLPFV